MINHPARDKGIREGVGVLHPVSQIVVRSFSDCVWFGV